MQNTGMGKGTHSQAAKNGLNWRLSMVYFVLFDYMSDSLHRFETNTTGVTHACGFIWQEYN